MRVGRRIDTSSRTTAREWGIARTSTLPARRASRLQYEYTFPNAAGRAIRGRAYADAPVLRRVKD